LDGVSDARRTTSARHRRRHAARGTAATNKAPACRDCRRQDHGAAHATHPRRAAPSSRSADSNGTRTETRARSFAPPAVRLRWPPPGEHAPAPGSAALRRVPRLRAGRGEPHRRGSGWNRRNADTCCRALRFLARFHREKIDVNCADLLISERDDRHAWRGHDQRARPVDCVTVCLGRPHSSSPP